MTLSIIYIFYLSKYHAADSWMSTTSHIESQERQPLYHPPPIRLNSPQPPETSALDLAIRNKNGSSTSTPIESHKMPSLGGLIRPIPSRLGSPFSPILTTGVPQSPSHILAKNLTSSAVNPFTLNVLGSTNMTSQSNLKELMENQTNNSQKLSLKSGGYPKEYC